MRLARVGTSHGLLFLDREAGQTLLHDGIAASFALSDDQARELGRVLDDATARGVDDPTQRARVAGTVALDEARSLHVVRWPFAVSVHDHSDPLSHAGWSVGVDQAQELAEALLAVVPAGPQQ